MQFGSCHATASPRATPAARRPPASADTRRACVRRSSCWRESAMSAAGWSVPAPVRATVEPDASSVGTSHAPPGWRNAGLPAWRWVGRSRTSPVSLRGRRGAAPASGLGGDQETSARVTASGSHRRHLRLRRHLTLATLAPELYAGFVEEAVAVEPARGELTARGVEGERTVESNAGAPLDKGSALALPAELQRLEPEHGQVAEPVIDLCHVDVGRGEGRAPPHLGGRVGADRARQVLELVPAGPVVDRRAHRLDVDRRLGQVPGQLAPRDDEGGGAIARYVAVEEAQRRRDDPGVEVVLEGQGFPVDRLGVQAGVAPAV